jgi:hypothetical protein
MIFPIEYSLLNACRKGAVPVASGIGSAPGSGAKPYGPRIAYPLRAATSPFRVTGVSTNSAMACERALNFFGGFRSYSKTSSGRPVLTGVECRERGAEDALCPLPENRFALFLELLIVAAKRSFARTWPSRVECDYARHLWRMKDDGAQNPRQA